MSWLFGRPPSATDGENRVPEITQSQKQRHKQIESLREHIPGVVEVKRDEHYRTNVTVQGNTLTLDIALPPRFPLVGPVVTVSPPVQHPWVDGQMKVDGSPLIKNFTVHSNLGKAVTQVIKEFLDHPPVEVAAMSIPQPQLPGLSYPRPDPTYSFPQPPVMPTGGFSPYTFTSTPGTIIRGGAAPSPEARPRRPAPPPPSMAARPSKRYTCPPVPETLPDIRNLSTEELKKFLSDSEGPVLTDEYVSKMDAIKKVQVDRNNLFQENEDQASINLSHEPEIEEGWTHLQEKILELQALQEKHEKMLNEQRQLIQRYDGKRVASRLKTLANEAETDSEIMAEDFLDDSTQVAEFIQKYKDLRKLHHLRKAKYEKLTFERH